MHSNAKVPRWEDMENIRLEHPRPDHLLQPTDPLRAGVHSQHLIFASHMAYYLQKERISDQWKNSRTVLLHKKDDREDPRNCCVIWYSCKTCFTRSSRTHINDAGWSPTNGTRESDAWIPSKLWSLSFAGSTVWPWFSPSSKAFDNVETNVVCTNWKKE